jgi:probable HAF family extracellular repeat protein
LLVEQLEDRSLLSAYSLTILGGLGGMSSRAYDVNEAGQVVGISTNAASRTHAVLWQNGGITDLGTLGGPNSWANALNEAAAVAGSAQVNAGGTLHAFVWQGGGLTDVTPTSPGSAAYGINDAGQVVGSHNGGRAFLLDDGVFTDLGTLGSLPWYQSFANDINNAGQVVGSSHAIFNDDLGDLQHAFLWQDGALTDLGVLPGFDESVAESINASGQIVGTSTFVDQSTYMLEWRAFLYANGAMAALGVPTAHSGALDINDAGQVVGWMRGAGGFDPDRAFLYDDGVVTDLNTLIPPGSGVTLAAATAINNAGQIVGYTQGGAFAFLLTPIAPGTPSVSIGDATVTEGNAGTTNAIFTVTLSAPASGPVTVNFATGNGTASAGFDYAAQSGTITIPAGETTATVTVAVQGDTIAESNETFQVILSQPVGAVLLDGQGVGTIVDDEPRFLRISDVTLQEGRFGTKVFVFTVTLSAPSSVPVTVNFATANGTAQSTEDYNAQSGTLTFAPGQTSKTISIVVKGDGKRESNETFFVNLSGAVNALIADGQGVGTILNDD